LDDSGYFDEPQDPSDKVFDARLLEQPLSSLPTRSPICFKG